MLLTVAIPSLLAAEKSYTIMLDKGTNNSTEAVTKDNFISKLVTSGAEYISSVTGTDKVYPGTGCAKIGSSNNSGYFTLAIASSAQVVPTKIVLNAKKYNSDTGKLKINLNGATTTFGSETTPDTDFTDLVFSNASFTETVQSIKVSTTAKRANVKSITIYYEVADTELTAPKISGVTNGGVYWDPVTVNISKPTFATSIAYEIKKGEEIVASAAAATEAFSQVFSEEGTYTMTASATDGTDTKAAEAVSFEIKSTNVSSIADFLAKSELNSTATFTFTCPLTVTYANGKNVYVRDTAGDALLIYNSATVTGLVNGSMLEGVAGTYYLYNIIPEIKTTSLPTATAGEAVEPKLITIGDAAANLSQYVKIDGVKFNPETVISCGEETIEVSGTLPADVTAQYNVVGLISQSKSSGEWLPNLLIVSYEEVQVLGTPSIEVTGETNATGSYLDEATLKFVYPANATSMDYVVKKGDTVLGQAKNLKEGATLYISTCGEISIEVTATNGTDQTNESKTITVIPSAPTVSLAAGTYHEAQTLKITAPEGATLYGLLDGTDIENVSEYTTTLAAVNEETTTYELLVCSTKDGAYSDEVSATFVINPNVFDAEVTGNIVIADQTEHNTTGSSVKNLTLIDNLGQTFTLTRIAGSATSYMGIYGDGLRMYKNNHYELTSDMPMTKIKFTASAYDLNSNSDNWSSTETKTFVCEAGMNNFTFNSGTSGTSKIQSIEITYKGRFDYYKVKDGAALIGMEKGKFYQVNVNLEGVEANGGVLYACTSGSSAAPSEPRKTYFDKSYEDYDLTKFDQRDWVAIEGLTSAEYAGKEIKPKFIAAYDGEKLTPVTEIEPQGDAASYTLNTFAVANVFYGNYENMGDDFMPGGYKPFFVKAKVNEVANYVGEVKEVTGGLELWGSGVCGKLNNKGLKIDANGIKITASAEYQQIEGVLVADAEANGGVKLVALSAPTTPTGVAALKADGKATVYGTEGAVVVNGADGKVMIFDAMGRMVKSVNAEGAATVAMPAGYYIVRTAGTAAKVMVK